ncbi:35994_t:CDS:1, partial [Gigaspora margarita]
FTHLSLTKHSAKEEYIAICNPCTSASKCHNAPTLTTIPDALTNVSIFYWCWLFLIHLSCSLGCAQNSNCFIYYYYLTSEFGLSKNI